MAIETVRIGVVYRSIGSISCENLIVKYIPLIEQLLKERYSNYVFDYGEYNNSRGLTPIYISHIGYVNYKKGLLKVDGWGVDTKELDCLIKDLELFFNEYE